MEWIFQIQQGDAVSQIQPKNRNRMDVIDPLQLKPNGYYRSTTDTGYLNALKPDGYYRSNKKEMSDFAQICSSLADLHFGLQKLPIINNSFDANLQKI